MEPLHPHLASGQDRKTEAARPEDWEARELNHRLVNSLQLAVDFLGFHQQRAEDPKARQALEEAMARLAAVGQLHRYLSVRDPHTLVELSAFLRGLCSVIGLSTGLACELDAQPVSVPAHIAQHIGLLINECAINARKHAYGRDGGVLRIECAVTPGRLRITVADEGPGLRARSPQAGQGLGMSLIGAIVRELRGSFTAETRGGAAFTFVIPIAGASPVASRSFASWNEL